MDFEKLTWGLLFKNTKIMFLFICSISSREFYVDGIFFVPCVTGKIIKLPTLVHINQNFEKTIWLHIWVDHPQVLLGKLWF